jgi:hypothetical protein
MERQRRAQRAARGAWRAARGTRRRRAGRTCDALAVRLRQDVVEQRRLAGAQEAGDDLARARREGAVRGPHSPTRGEVPPEAPPRRPLTVAGMRSSGTGNVCDARTTRRAARARAGAPPWPRRPGVGPPVRGNASAAGRATRVDDPRLVAAAAAGTGAARRAAAAAPRCCVSARCESAMAWRVGWAGLGWAGLGSGAAPVQESHAIEWRAAPGRAGLGRAAPAPPRVTRKLRAGAGGAGAGAGAGSPGHSITTPRGCKRPPAAASTH